MKTKRPLFSRRELQFLPLLAGLAFIGSFGSIQIANRLGDGLFQPNLVVQFLEWFGFFYTFAEQLFGIGFGIDTPWIFWPLIGINFLAFTAFDYLVVRTVVRFVQGRV